MLRLNNLVNKLIKTADILDINGHHEAADRVEQILRRIAAVDPSNDMFYYGPRTVFNPMNNINRKISPNAPALPFLDESGNMPNKPIQSPYMTNNRAQNEANIRKYQQSMSQMYSADAQRNVQQVRALMQQESAHLDSAYQQGQIDQAQYYAQRGALQQKYDRALKLLTGQWMQEMKSAGQNTPSYNQQEYGLGMSQYGYYPYMNGTNPSAY